MSGVGHWSAFSVLLSPSSFLVAMLVRTQPRKVECKKGHRRAFDPHFSKKTFSKQFVNIEWGYALKIVHAHAWQKWHLVKDDPAYKLQTGQEEQKPGIVPQELLDSLQSTIDDLPPAKAYKRQGSESE